MRKITDVISNLEKGVSEEELKKYYSLSDIAKGELAPIKVLYYFNISGFYIPFKPSVCSNGLNKVEGWIELAKAEKKIEYHDSDGEKSKEGDIDITDFHIARKDEQVKRFIRIPDYYIYTNIHLKVKKNTYKQSNLTGEDIHMLDDENNINEIAICDSHEDGA